jgi:hypothetical protein
MLICDYISAQERLAQFVTSENKRFCGWFVFSHATEKRANDHYKLSLTIQ